MLTQKQGQPSNDLLPWDLHFSATAWRPARCQGLLLGPSRCLQHWLEECEGGLARWALCVV